MITYLPLTGLYTEPYKYLDTCQERFAFENVLTLCTLPNSWLSLHWNGSLSRG